MRCDEMLFLLPDADAMKLCPILYLFDATRHRFTLSDYRAALGRGPGESRAAWTIVLGIPTGCLLPAA